MRGPNRQNKFGQNVLPPSPNASCKEIGFSPTAFLAVVARVAVAVPNELHHARLKGKAGRKIVVVTHVEVVLRHGEVVVINARGTGVDAREATVIFVPAGEFDGADAGACAAVATVVT